MFELDSLNDVELGGASVDEHGALSEVGHGELLDAVWQQGCMGFVEKDGERWRVTIWTDGDRTFEELLFFFGHEVGHTEEFSIPTSTMPKEVADFVEEERADQCALVALQAYRLAKGYQEALKEEKPKVVQGRCVVCRASLAAGSRETGVGLMCPPCYAEKSEGTNGG
jgi:hypothetical protein